MTSARGPEQPAPEAKKHKGLLRVEGKMQSTKHNELLLFPILPEQRKQNTKKNFPINYPAT